MNVYSGFATYVALAASVALAGASCGSKPGKEKEGAKVPEVGSWRPMTPLPLSLETVGVESGAVAWSGSELLVWGGESGIDCGLYGLCAGGARYSVVGSSWVSMATTGAPSARRFPGSTWARDRLVVWGGEDLGTVGTGQGVALPLGDGAVYSPTSDSWAPMAQTAAPAAREQHSAIWTGSHVIVWGGLDLHLGYQPVNNPLTLGDGAAYDPAADAWTPVSSVDAPSPRYGHAVVWTGSLMLVWGGTLLAGSDWNRTPLGDGAAYDPGNDTWHKISTVGAPPACGEPTGVWTGSTLLVWGCTGGGEYDPVADRWFRISDYGAPDSTAHTAVWSGSAMLTWTGANGPSGGVYDPATDSWERMPATGAPTSPRWYHDAVWTGAEMLIFGGHLELGEYRDGALFTP